ncbi:MAG: D-2-hydroxyacid dehydrogenase [Alphaproteobacteria bacterium]|nr:D-2-hydroxyacid dehydrogenase [Alphaproteobacteria bacterium]
MAQGSDIRLVVVGKAAEAWLTKIRRRCPAVSGRACQTAGTLRRAIERFRPNVAFTAKTAVLDQVTWPLLLESPDLRWMHIANVGFDHVPAWDAAHLVVTNSGGAAADAMAEYVIGAMIMANCGYVDYFGQQRRRQWRKKEWTPLRGKTLTAVGVGQIGRRIIAGARRLGMRVIAVRSSGKPVPGAALTLPSRQLHRGLKAADFVSIQVPLNRRTRGMFDRKALAQLRPHAWLINVARGGVIDEKALIAALTARRIGGAVLDVVATEPLPRASPLWRLDNVVVTPHISGEIPDFYDQAIDIFCANLRRFCAGRDLTNVVDPSDG